jgi:hypothetical protein
MIKGCGIYCGKLDSAIPEFRLAAHGLLHGIKGMSQWNIFTISAEAAETASSQVAQERVNAEDQPQIASGAKADTAGTIRFPLVTFIAEADLAVHCKGYMRILDLHLPEIAIQFLGGEPTRLCARIKIRYLYAHVRVLQIRHDRKLI